MKIYVDLELVFDKIKDICTEFDNKTFLITGGTGFFGKWILNFFIYLKEKKDINIKAYILSRNPDKFLKNYPIFKKDYFIFIKGDIRNFKFNYKADNILHMAATNAEETFNNHNPLDKFQSSAFGIQNILNIAKEQNIEKFLFCSSGSIYGKNCKEKYISENCLTSPDILDYVASALPEGKRVSEFYCSYYADKFDLDIVIARCFGFVGYYLPLDIHYAVGNFIKEGYEKKKITINSNGKAVRSYMYMSDLLIWLFSIMFKGRKANAYNVGSDEEISILDLAKKIASIYKIDKIEILNKGAKSTSAPNRYVPDISKAKNELNLQIYTNLDTALYKTIRDYYEI